MTKTAMVQLAQHIAARHKLDPALVCAICHHESNNWQTWASRYEPGFYATYIATMADVQRFGPTISLVTEKMLRSTSFGLMQVMGQVARERGFKGEYLTELCEPEVGIEFGCRELDRRILRANGDIRAGLLGYNGGGNPQYPAIVLAHYGEYSNGRTLG